MSIGTKRLFAWGIIPLTATTWLEPLLVGLAHEIVRRLEPLPRHAYSELSFCAFKIVWFLYAVGVLVTVVAICVDLQQRWKHDRTRLFHLDPGGWKTWAFYTDRVFAAGVLFLLAPAWAFTFINPMAIYIVETNLAGRPYNFLMFDWECIGLEYGTTHILYNTGVAVMAAALAMLAVGKWVRER